MEKPLSLKRLDLVTNITKAVNESELPAFIVLDVLQLLTAQVSELAGEQIKADREAYQKALLEETQEDL